MVMWIGALAGALVLGFVFGSRAHYLLVTLVVASGCAILGGALMWRILQVLR